MTDLSGEDLKSRSNNEYVDKGPDPAKHCAGCKLFKPAGEGQCGGCTQVKGPINPNGSCKAWAPKT